MSTEFTEQTTLALDANAASTTVALEIKENNFVSWTVLADTGAHTTHILTLQCSLDGTNWGNTSSTITGTGSIEDNVQVTSKFVRVKVTTLEGGASTVDILINAK